MLFRKKMYFFKIIPTKTKKSKKYFRTENRNKKAVSPEEKNVKCKGIVSPEEKNVKFT